MTLTLAIANVATLDNGMPTEFVLHRRGAVIGRAATCDWCLPDPRNHVSSRHCEVRFDGSAYTLSDTSTNGTYLNGAGDRMAAPRRIEDGDRFQIGHYDVRARLSGDAYAAAQHAPVEPPPAEWRGWDAGFGSPAGGATPARPHPRAAGTPRRRPRRAKADAGSPRWPLACRHDSPIRALRPPRHRRRAEAVAGHPRTVRPICRHPRPGKRPQPPPIPPRAGRAARPIGRLRRRQRTSGAGLPRAMSSTGHAAASASPSSRRATRLASIRPPRCPASARPRLPQARTRATGAAPRPPRARYRRHRRTPPRRSSPEPASRPIASRMRRPPRSNAQAVSSAASSPGSS